MTSAIANPDNELRKGEAQNKTLLSVSMNFTVSEKNRHTQIITHKNKWRQTCVKQRVSGREKLHSKQIQQFYVRSLQQLSEANTHTH